MKINMVQKRKEVECQKKKSMDQKNYTYCKVFINALYPFFLNKIFFYIVNSTYKGKLDFHNKKIVSKICERKTKS